MPVVKNLKKLQKKQSSTQLHPNGRKFKQLGTAELRQSKLNTLKAKRNDLHERKLERHRFFQALDKQLQKDVYTEQELRTMCEEFVNRNLPELQEMEKSRRPGRAPTNKHQQLKLLYDNEQEEFTTGLNVIDLTDPKTVENIRRWDGEWGGLNTLKMTRITRA